MPGAGFKVKISDGSVVGPLDPDMLKSWYEQGLIDRQTPVLPAGTKSWRRLEDVFDVSQSSRAGATNEDFEGEEDRAPREFPRAGRLLAAGVLIAGAAGALAVILMPGTWRSDLEPVPWREIGYVQLLLALVALHDAEWSRRVARVGVFLGAFCVFPAIGFAIAQGVGLDAYLVLGSAWLLGSGLFFLLGPHLPWTQLAASLAAILVGLYGIVRFGVVMGAAASVSASSNTAWIGTILK